MPVGFRDTLISAAQDHVIDRREWQELRAMGQKSIANRDKEAWMARQVIPYLDQFKRTTEIKYGIPGAALQFSFTPTYSELDELPGKTAVEQVSNVAQRDTLSETNDDTNRCGAGALLNAWLLLGGQFGEAAERLGLSATQRNLTYQNLHLAQEALYDSANTDGSDGLTSSFSFSHRRGTIVSTTLTQEVAAAVNKLGLKANVLVGETKETLHQRQGNVEKFFAQNPQGVLMAGIHLDTTSGDLTSVSAENPMNHFVLVHREGQDYYLVDTGASDNGAGNSRRKLDADQMKGFIFQTSAHVMGLTR